MAAITGTTTQTGKVPMAGFGRVLCPVDFSEHSRHALDYAVAVARWYAGRVTALHVLRPVQLTEPMLADAVVYTADDLERTALDLERFVGEESGSTPIESRIVEGTAVATIVRQATELPADLLVLGTHGLSGFEHFMLGSVTERVLRQAPCPVLTVPPRAPDAGPVAFRQILCPIDFSPASMKALAYAASLARESNASLTVMHVVEPFAVSEPMIMGSAGVRVYEEEAVAATRVRLHASLPLGDEVKELVLVGKPYRVILDQSQQEGSDLIVIGVHSGLMDRLGFFGSTTNHIVREAACPVLSVRG